MEVLLIVPPFASIKWPSMGCSLLKAILKKNKINTEVLYLNILFRNKFLFDYYERLIDSINFYTIGEILFAPFAFPSEIKKIKQFKKKNKLKYIENIGKRNISINDINKIGEKIEEFLSDAIKIVLNKKPDIIGFSNNFQQTCSSIAIANYIKKEAPFIINIMGGYNCHEPMCNEISKITPSIDYIFCGEAEKDFLSFCKNAIRNIYPKNKLIKCTPVKNLNELPYPDFSDYISQMKKNGLKNEIGFFNFESSRGCWWKKRSCCIFCSNDHYEYRTKSPDRIKKEFSFLSKKYDIQLISASDSIMPENFPESVFINLQRLNKIRIFYEIKPPMQFRNLEILKNNGIISCQPGIESLNDNILKILKKGVTAYENIKFLRDCKTLGIYPQWNFLYAIPGDKEEYYYDMINNIIPYIIHLQAPMKVIPINMHRYSPLFENNKKYNIKKIKPVSIYSYIFPHKSNTDNLTFYFEGEYDNAFKNKKLRVNFFSILKEWYDIWHKNKIRPVLEIYKLKNNMYAINDTRKMSKIKFNKIKEKEYNQLMKFKLGINKKEIHFYDNDIFKRLLENKYILKIGDSYLSIVNEIRNNK